MWDEWAVCVYCASGPTDPDLLALADALGAAIAERGWTLVSGGGNVSAMGAVAGGARLARGCTSGQALSGGSVLSVGSWAFMFAIFGGGYAVAYFVRKLWN